MGIAVAMTSKGAPTARAVVLHGTPAAPGLVDAQEILAPHEELAATLAEAASAFTSLVKGLNVEAVLIRRANQSHHATKSDGPRTRLLMEGAIAAALRGPVPRTVLRDGRQAGLLYGSTQEDLDLTALALATTIGCPAKYREALGAALAAMSL
jgi:hypothetical protein